MLNSSELFSYTTIDVQVSSQLNHYFLSYRVHRHTHTPRQTDGRTDRQTDTHTDGHEYSIVAVDKPQL